MAPGPENKFRDKFVRPWLDTLDKCEYDVNQAMQVRGVPDLSGVVNGRAFYMEFKKNGAECRARTGRIVLQRRNLDKRRAAGAFAEFVSPDNWDEIRQKLYEFAYH